LLRCLVWLSIHTSLRLERIRFFEHDAGYAVLVGRNRKYLISSSQGRLTVEAGRRGDIKELCPAGTNEEGILRIIMESEYELI
jgi:hypothetical protein